MNKLIKNAKIVNEGIIREMDILIEGSYISRIDRNISVNHADIIDAQGQYVLPGIIDDQVHFREPGLTYKATILTESRACLAGGITTFIEQPNTNPQTTTKLLLEEKMTMASLNSYVNYSFMFGGTNDNLEEIKSLNKKACAGIKLFLGASTGNMLIDNEAVLESIFRSTELIISTHCEDEATIKENMAYYIAKYGDDIPIELHPKIRSSQACYISSSKAVALAKKTGARLHVFHVSTGEECLLFDNSIPLEKKKITSEACIHHLWFSDEDYKTKQTLIKWNPAIKTPRDRDTILDMILEDYIDVIATDHSPHTLQEKQKPYTKAPSGGPLVQHALPAILEMYHRGKISLTKIVEKMSHNPAILFQIHKRGYLREGYFADMVLVDLESPWEVSSENILYKCGWSPFEGITFQSKITHTFVNGHLAYNKGIVSEDKYAMRLIFDR